MINQKPLIGELIDYGHPIAEGIAVYCPFYEGRGVRTFDCSGNNYHSAVFSGDAVVWVKDTWKDNHSGWTIDFGATNDFFVIPFRPSQGKLSVACWINFDDLSSSRAIGMHDGANHRLYFGSFVDVPRTEAYFGFGDSFRSDVNHGMSENTWHFLAITGDGTTAKYYVDCVEKDSLTYTWSGTSSHDFYVGQVSNDSHDFDGSLAWLSIWNRCVALDELRYIYQYKDLSFLIGKRRRIIYDEIAAAPGLSIPIAMHHYKMLKAS